MNGNKHDVQIKKNQQEYMASIAHLLGIQRGGLEVIDTGIKALLGKIVERGDELLHLNQTS